MYHNFKPDVFDTWLEAWTTDVWDLNEVGLLIVAVVPSAVKWDGHSSIRTEFKSGAGDHNISM